MYRSNQQLHDDALRIWQAGVNAVSPMRLIPETISLTGNQLFIVEEEIDLSRIGRIAVVGAGKAGASMVTAFEACLGGKLLKSKLITGWVNVPADCVQETEFIHLHPARPAGMNEPKQEGITGTQKIIDIVTNLGPRDICFCLISGGGSALMPAPIDDLSLEDKVEITRRISASGGTIQQLNTVRRELSNVKGGGLARACKAGRLISLILSDVLGDDLETIASGPTVPRSPTPEAAIKVLEELKINEIPSGSKAIQLLNQKNNKHETTTTKITNLLIGNNATAVDAAGIEAERLGYSHAMMSATESEGTAEQVAERLAEMAQSMRDNEGPNCLITGGEPTVHLAPSSERGKGGRNQQLVLATLEKILDWNGIALLSGGTDGEDGPTDAAGAIANKEIYDRAKELQLVPEEYLRRNDAYHFFEKLEALIKTGPTHTNVCDLRVVTVSQK